MMPSIADVAGLNRLSRMIFSRAAGAICGMVEAHDGSRRRTSAGRRQHVRQHDRLRHRGEAHHRGGGLRSARLRRHRCGRTIDGSADRERPGRRRARSNHHRVGGRTGRRSSQRRPGTDGRRRQGRRARGRGAGLPRHGELRRARLGPGEIRRPDFLHPQSAGHADADHAGGMRRTRPHPRGKGQSLPRAGRDHDSEKSDQRDQRGRPAVS